MAGRSTPNAFPRRLSKPRIGTSSVLLSPSDREAEMTSSTLYSDQQDYFGDHAAVVSSQGERRSRRKSRSKIRAYLHGSNSGILQTPSDDEDGPSTLVGAAHSVKKRLSRTGSSMMQLQSAKASSARLSDSSGSRLQLTGSKSSDAEESTLLADQIKEKAYQDSITAQNHVKSPMDESKHVDSIMAPVRRKSLYTPGLATRNPSDILKKPPQSVMNNATPDHDYYYDPSKPKESPLSQLAALHLGEDGRSTPSQINYPQLGGLKLGTLRVTNGTASPAPQRCSPRLVCRSPTPESQIHDECCTVSGGNIEADPPFVMSPRDSSPLRSERDDDIRVSGSKEGHVNLRRLQHRKPDCATSMAYEYMSEFGGGPFSQCDIPSMSVDKSSIEDLAMTIPRTKGSELELWERLIDNAEIQNDDDETQEDAFRKLVGNVPFAPNGRRPSNPSSKKPRRDDYLEASNTDSGYCSKSSLNVAAHSYRGCRTSSSISLEDDEIILEGNPPRSKSPEMGAEVRVRNDCGPQESAQLVPEQVRYSSQETNSRLHPYSIAVMPQHAPQAKAEAFLRSPSQKPARKLQKLRPKSQTSSPVVVGHGCGELAQACIPRVPSIIATKHAERLRQFPLLDHTFPSSQHTTSHDHTAPTGSYVGIYPLPIRFPSPANALEAATTGDLVESKAFDETEMSPKRTMPKPFANSTTPDDSENFRTRVPLKHRHSMFAQVEDGDWPTSGIIRSPSWSKFGQGKKTKEQKKLAKQEQKDEKRLAKEEKDFGRRLQKDQRDFEKQNKKYEEKNKSIRSRSASRTRAKSSDRSSYNDSVAIADFGTVTESLGRSPYAIATSMLPRTTHEANHWHPYQISTAMSSASPIARKQGMAADYFTHARNRASSQTSSMPSMPPEETFGPCDSNQSRLRPQTMFVNTPAVPAVAAVDLNMRGLGWVKGDQINERIERPVMFGGLTADDPCDSPMRSTRLRGIIIDAPPVPALPSALEVKQREAQITKSRPQSLKINSSAPLTPSLPTTDMVTDVSGPDTQANHCATTKDRSVPDLWTSGSLERKVPKPIEISAVVETSLGKSPCSENAVADEVDVWETQRQAWRQRRKSAGEALLKTHMTGNLGSGSTPYDHSPSHNDQHDPLASTTASTAHPHDRVEATRPRLTPLHSFPDPSASVPHKIQRQPFEAATPQLALASQETNKGDQSSHWQARQPRPNLLTPDLRVQAQRPASTSSIPRKDIGSEGTTPTQALGRLTGRYDGGLLYGYEPGCGLGGSAGTRGTQTAASRKSVDVSKGFGLDLSDVPIFVAPTTAR